GPRDCSVWCQPRVPSQVYPPQPDSTPAGSKLFSKDPGQRPDQQGSVIPMPKMRTVDAIVQILEKEGATEAFGLPGAAINPLYSAMKDHGGIRHTLHRHVEGAS